MLLIKSKTVCWILGSLILLAQNCSNGTGRGGEGQVVSVFANCSDDLSSNPANNELYGMIKMNEKVDGALKGFELRSLGPSL